MEQLIQECNSPRADDGVWVWTYGEQIKTPIYFEWKGVTDTGSTIDLEISPTCPIVFTLKRDERDTVPVFQKTFYALKNNTILFEMSTQEILQIRPGITYVAGMILYDENMQNVIRVLIRRIPVKVLNSTVESGEYYGNNQ